MTTVKVYFPSQYLEYKNVADVTFGTSENMYITLENGTEICLPRMWSVVEETQ